MSVFEDRRRRGMLIGAAGIVIGLLITMVVGVIGVQTVLRSRAGQAVGSNANYSAKLPYTPTGLIGVLDRTGTLVSVAVVVVDPSGAGGTIVVAAPMADAASGTGDTFEPLDRVLATSGIEAFADQAELMTRLSFDVIEIMTPQRFAALIEPVSPFNVELPIGIRDAATNMRWPEGRAAADATEAASILTARDQTIDDWYFLPARSAVWSSVAIAVGEGVGKDEIPGGELTTPGSMDELWSRLIAGPVTSRALVAQKVGPEEADARLDPSLQRPGVSAPVVVHDRAEMLSIFAAIAPGRLGSPNAAARLRIVNRFPDTDIAGVGGGWTVPSMWKLVIDGLLYGGANVVSIEELPGGSIPEMTQVEVLDGQISDEDRDTLTVIFGEFEAVAVDSQIQGVDATVILGRSFLTHLAESSIPTLTYPTGADAVVNTTTTVVTTTPGAATATGSSTGSSSSGGDSGNNSGDGSSGGSTGNASAGSATSDSAATGADESGTSAGESSGSG